MLKTTIKESFKELLTNRYLTILSGLTVLLMISFVIYIFLSVHPSELQLVTHYTAYGVTHLYRDQWFYLLTFALFGLIVAAFHVIVAIKIYITKGHPLAIMFAWLGVAIIIFAGITSFSIINVWSPV